MQPYIDFTIIETNDPKYLSINDLSNWVPLEEKPSIIEITKPDEEEKIVHEFTKNAVNNFKSQSFKVS